MYIHGRLTGLALTNSALTDFQYYNLVQLYLLLVLFVLLVLIPSCRNEIPTRLLPADSCMQRVNASVARTILPTCCYPIEVQEVGYKLSSFCLKLLQNVV